MNKTAAAMLLTMFLVAFASRAADLTWDRSLPTTATTRAANAGSVTAPAGRAEGLATRRPRDLGWLEPTRLRLAAGVLAGALAVYGVLVLLLARRAKARALVVSMTVLVTALSCAAVGCAWAAMVGSDQRE